MAELVFVRVRNCTTEITMENVQASLATIGRVLRSGLGVVTDPGAAWFVVRLRRCLRVEDVRGELNRTGIGSWVDCIERVANELEGPALAKQLRLCG